MRTSETIGEVAGALSKFQAELAPVAKTHPVKDRGGRTMYLFADLADVREEVAPKLAKHGLCFLQSMVLIEGRECMATRIMHTSGEWIEVYVPMDANDMQAVGSRISYARRYSLGVATSVVTDEDDDGASGSATEGDNAKPKPKGTGKRTDVACPECGAAGMWGNTTDGGKKNLRCASCKHTVWSASEIKRLMGVPDASA